MKHFSHFLLSLICILFYCTVYGSQETILEVAEWLHIADKIESQYIQKIVKKTDLIPYQVGGGSCSGEDEQRKIDTCILGFRTPKELSPEEANCLMLQIAFGYLEVINKELGYYLKLYPFNLENVQISIHNPLKKPGEQGFNYVVTYPDEVRFWHIYSNRKCETFSFKEIVLKAEKQGCDFGVFCEDPNSWVELKEYYSEGKPYQKYDCENGSMYIEHVKNFKKNVKKEAFLELGYNTSLKALISEKVHTFVGEGWDDPTSLPSQEATLKGLENFFKSNELK